MNIKDFLDKINQNGFLNEGELNQLKSINEISLLSIFQNISDNYDGSVYLLKCYMTVMDSDVFQLTYDGNESIVELGLSRLWKDEMRHSKMDDVIEAYIPINLFSTKIISYFRNGINKYYNQGLFEFDIFIHEMIMHLTDKRDFVISKLMFNNLDNENNDLLSRIQMQDSDLVLKLLNVYDNLMVASILIDYSYVNNPEETKRIKKIVKKELSEKYNHVDMDIVSGFFSYDLLESINSDFHIQNKSYIRCVKSKVKKLLSSTSNNNYHDRVENDPEIGLVDINFNAIDTFEESEDALIDMFEQGESDNDLNIRENKDMIDTDSDLLVNSQPIEKSNNKSNKRFLFKLKKRKNNRFKDEYYKKDGGLKIIILSIMIIFASAFSVYKIISSEIEKENRIYEIQQESSQSDVLVNIIND